MILLQHLPTLLTSRCFCWYFRGVNMLLQHRLRIGGWVGKQEILLRYITGSAGPDVPCMVRRNRRNQRSEPAKLLRKDSVVMV